MSWPYLFRAGYAYAAGFDKPGVVGIGTIRSKVEGKGFRVVAAYECEGQPGMPFAVLGSCPDDWDWIGLVIRTGPTRVIEVPDRCWWIVEIPPASIAVPPDSDKHAPPDLKGRCVTNRPEVTGKPAALAVGAGVAFGSVAGAAVALLGAGRWQQVGAPAVIAAGALAGGLSGAAWAARW